MRSIGKYELPRANVHLIGVVKGLVSEGEQVERLILKRRPDVVALGISPEELDGLRKCTKEDIEDHQLTRYEENYTAGLARFGEVAFPPPSFVKAVSTADREGIRTVALDMVEEEYTDLYCKEVSALTVVLHTARIPVIDRRAPHGKTPEDYARWWDSKVNDMKGFKKLTRAREKVMADNLTGLEGNILAFIGIARTNGVKENLTTG